MKNTEIKDKYNNLIGNELGDTYEFKRWFSTPKLKAGYDQTQKFIICQVRGVNKNTYNYIELGPGPGTWTKFFLEKKLGGKTTLVDISKSMLDLSRKNLADYQVNFIESDFCLFSTADKFDFFFSSRAIEYFADKEKVVDKINSILSIGGRGAIITKTPKYFVNKVLGRKNSDFHSGQISPCQLAKLFKQSGFKNVRVSPVVFSVPLIKSPKVDLLFSRLFGWLPLAVTSYLTESYAITFEK
jgi:ubiquinone/menaquinone biosynthesis C-methylase UbiE